MATEIEGDELRAPDAVVQRLGEIVRAYTSVIRQGGSLKLLNVTARVHELLTITKLLSVFDLFDAEAEAVKSFGVVRDR